MLERDPELKADRAVLNNQEAYIVTAVVHLPFAKNDVISESESRLYTQKYPKRFQAAEESETIEDPCYIVINGGDSPFERGDIILEREQGLLLLTVLTQIKRTSFLSVLHLIQSPTTVIRLFLQSPTQCRIL